MSTALAILNVAYQDHNLDTLSSFDSSLEFPYNLAKNILNEVIRDLNRLGNYWFCETKTNIPYYLSTYAYSFRALEIDPKRIKYIRRDALNYQGELQQMNYRDFQKTYRLSSVSTGSPSTWSKYGDTLELNVVPDRDYSLFAYHYQDMPLITVTTDSQSTGSILVPEADEDLLERGCYQYLGYKIGKWAYQQALEEIYTKARPFLVSVDEDAGIARQMPANF